MKFSPLLDDLIREFVLLPGVGPKSAQRMAFQLLERERSRGQKLARTLERALTEIGHCQHCRTFTENELCELCANQSVPKSVSCAWSNRLPMWRPWSRPISIPVVTLC